MIKKMFKKIYRSKEDITKEELLDMIKTNPEIVLLDVRSEQEFKEGHLNNAINIPSYEIYTKVQEVIKDKRTLIIAYCQVGVRSKKAVKVLKKLGYKNSYNLKDGIE